MNTNTENREPRNKPAHSLSKDFRQGRRDHSTGERTVFSTVVLGQLDIGVREKEVGPSPYCRQIVAQNGSKALTEEPKLLEGNTGGNLHGVGLGSGFLAMTPKAPTAKGKIDMLEPSSKLKILYVRVYY